jgi:hypothetical protein
MEVKMLIAAYGRKKEVYLGELSERIAHLDFDEENEIDDCGYLLCNYRNGFWYDANSGAACAEWITNNIIAWKEIVFPKEV